MSRAGLRGLVGLAFVAGSRGLSGQVPVPMIRLSSPSVVIGGASGPVDELLLAGVIGASQLPNGVLVIGDGAAPRILMFSPGGRFLSTVGGRGDGPGEFRVPRWLGPCGTEGFAVYDVSQKRVTMFSATATVRGTRSVAAAAGFSQVLRCLPESLVFLFSRPSRLLIQGGSRWTVATALTRVTDRTVDTLDARTGDQEYYVNRAHSGFAEVPLGRLVLGSAGRNRVYTCTNQDGHCKVFDAAGMRLGEFVVSTERLRVSASDWNRAIDSQLNAEPMRENRQLMAEVLREVPRPAAFPLIDRIRGDSEDRLWVRTFAGYGTSDATWLILSERGRLLARVIAPRELQILEIGKDYVLGVSQDRDGVETVSLYRFLFPSY